MERNRKAAALEELSFIEKKIDEGSALPSDTKNRLNLLHELEIIDKFASMDLIQKARVKWDIEGDENTKFFHGLINQKRRNQMINGIMVEGNWITDPSLIKDAFFNFTNMDQDYLERLVTHEEIKVAVWDCGSSKAPGPDGFSFAFVKKYWDIIKKDLHDFINSFLASCDMTYGANSSFFTPIPKVNNHTLITDFCPISLIGTHYKIIAKILANRLSKVIDKIVSKEQSAFIAGRLHNAFADAVDDVIITIDWNARDLENIIRVLHVFYLALGLKINIHKSNIYSIGVNEDEVYNMASNAGCIAGNIPFNYLGLPIGSNMKSIASWKMLIDHFRSRLSTWKASLLSIEGRLTLIKIRSNFVWGGNQDGKKMAWVKWSIILNSYDNGGLNIGSLKAFNLALLQKWRWRFFTSSNDLWVKVVKAFHGHEGGFVNNGCSFKGTWANIVGSSNFLHSKGIILNNSFRFNAGCGTRIHFWKDIWVGEAPLSISEDTCVWNLGPNGTFTVKDARNIIDQKTLHSLPSTSWDKIIPREVNIFMWRLSLDRLPHRLNLSLRGMDIQAISCSSCNANVESANYIFFECIMLLIYGSSCIDGAKSRLSKLYPLRRLKIGYPLGMLLKKRNTGFSSFLPRFFGGFGDSEIRQFDFILDGLAEVPSNDRVFGQWLNALFQKAAFLSRLLPRGLFGVSSKTTSE
ncbi:RNA-directed DNA polymerase, eukaryota, reverse transcriptase zinc-binding domain protein [Tanacetum coccineum]|uniref:RNA-directed DNA polymerase, eukaryota, reverse transcriptase zinc-binding domain protein n=1 Tax=Tanacetum coccineum TaxID=301880 RepID=A0ABQ5DUP0_9ASTR